jgi:hypothetical protein
MLTLNTGKLLLFCFILIAGWISGPASQSPKKIIYGKWISDKPLYDNKMELMFNVNGKYTEVTKNIKTKLVASKTEGIFKVIDDSTLMITTATRRDYHHLHFMTQNLLRFYPVKTGVKKPVPLLYVYNFVRE